MKFISLFAGIGGFDLALTRLGHECVYANEWDKYAGQVYRKHFGELDSRDIRTVPTSEIPSHDLLVGGFPCQAFSIAGKRRGFDDTRGTLFFEIARIARDKTPKYLLLENVKGLISHNEGKTLEIILETLQELGYYTNIEVYNSKNFGVPQNRERIFFICRHIKTLLEDGQNQKMTISKTIIQEYLFQILLNNLAEAKKLQEHNSKDLVVGYLLLKEINQNLNQSGENILGGIWIPTEEKSCQLKEEVWQNTDTWLSKNLGENYQDLNKSTILTVIKQIIESKTYTYSQMQKAILLAIVHLRESSKDLWNEVLSSLIVFQENTNYERVNVEKEKVVITEGRDAYIGEGYNSVRERVFIVGHLRGEPRPEVFPITGEVKQTPQSRDVAGTLQADYWKRDRTGGYVVETELQRINNPTHSNDRVYSAEGISPALNTMQGGRRQPKTIVPMRWVRTEKGKEYRRQAQKQGRDLTPFNDGYRELVEAKEDVTGCLTNALQKDALLKHSGRVRLLTPLECERLQGFPDGWTEGVSDTQRYKCLGNAVTVNVVYEIAKRLNA